LEYFPYVCQFGGKLINRRFLGLSSFFGKFGQQCSTVGPAAENARDRMMPICLDNPGMRSRTSLL
jgi:hypothetical protein